MLRNILSIIASLDTEPKEARPQVLIRKEIAVPPFHYIQPAYEKKR